MLTTTHLKSFGETIAVVRFEEFYGNELKISYKVLSTGEKGEVLTLASATKLKPVLDFAEMLENIERKVLEL